LLYVLADDSDDGISAFEGRYRDGDDYGDEDHSEEDYDIDKLNVERLREYANELRAEYEEESLRHPEWTVKKIQLTDQSGQFY
jgi:hypothetical protein